MARLMCDIPGMSSATYDVVLFDLDGTLTDSAPGILNGLEYALVRMYREVPDMGAMRAHLGPPLADTFRMHFGMDDVEISRAIALYREHYHEVGLFENDVYAGVPELLSDIADAGAILAVATSKPTYSATRILEHFELATYLTFIGGAELDGSRDGKSAVIAHTLASLAELGHYSPGTRVIMIGDREHDVQGARAHGIDTIGVLWGYGSAEELTTAGAIGLAESPVDLKGPLTR